MVVVNRREVVGAEDEAPGLDLSLNSRGNDLFFDYDRDGDQDLLIILAGKPVLYETSIELFGRLYM